VGLVMNKEASKSYLGWEGVNSRIRITHFIIKNCRVLEIESTGYAFVEPTDRDGCDLDQFSLQLQEQLVRVPDRNMVFLLRYFNAQVGRDRK